MKRNKLIIAFLAGTLILTGCGANAPNQAINEGKNLAVTSEVTDNEETVVNVNYDAAGEIIKFADGQVDILSGDIVETYKVSNDMLKDFYLGQIVTLTKEGPDEYSMMALLEEDFSIRHTTMGDLIVRVSGQVIKVSEDQVTIQTDDGEKTYKKSSDMVLELNQEYEFDLIENMNLITAAYGENAKITAKVQSINRLEDGEMELLVLDSNDIEYILRISQAVKNFNMSELAVGQTIDFYAEIMTMSLPPQAGPTRVDLLDEPATGVTSVEYDIIGDIIEFDGNNVHVLMGDIADIYTFDKETLKNFYLGEKVKIYNKDGQMTIESYLETDFSVRHSNMGHMIEEVKGEVLKVDGQASDYKVTVKTATETKTYNYYGEQAPQVGTYYEIETMMFIPDDKSIINFYDPATIIVMTIDALERADNGALILSATDEKDGKYTIGTANQTVNFNLSELKVGDTLMVYADAVMESWPMQVDSRKILKK